MLLPDVGERSMAGDLRHGRHTGVSRLDQNHQRRYRNRQGPTEQVVVDFFYNARLNRLTTKYNYLLTKYLFKMASTVLKQQRQFTQPAGEEYSMNMKKLVAAVALAL